MERTLVIIKPDGVKKGLIGEITSRFESAGLRLEAIKMLIPSQELIMNHYPEDEHWLRSVGDKTLQFYQTYGLNPIAEVGTDDNLTIGIRIKKWLVDYLTSGPVVAMILTGNHAVEVARKITGSTIPVTANSGTIRGDLSIDSVDVANEEKRAIHNLVHASGSVEEAEIEITLWFGGK